MRQFLSGVLLGVGRVVVAGLLLVLVAWPAAVLAQGAVKKPAVAGTGAGGGEVAAIERLIAAADALGAKNEVDEAQEKFMDADEKWTKDYNGWHSKAEAAYARAGHTEVFHAVGPYDAVGGELLYKWAMFSRHIQIDSKGVPSKPDIEDSRPLLELAVKFGSKAAKVELAKMGAAPSAAPVTQTAPTSPSPAIATGPMASIGTQTAANSAASGYELSGVVFGGPAAKAGLMGGDIIVAVDGEPVKDSATVTTLLKTKTVGSTMKVVYLRGGAAQMATIVLEERTKLYPSELDVATLSQRAIAGDTTAERELGYRYAYGIRGVGKDRNLAMSWMTKSAESGDAMGQDELGSFYYSGVGVAKDYTQAMIWFAKSAAQGYYGAQYVVAYMYEAGNGATKDYAQALRLHEKAAAMGSLNSMDRIALMYENGEGVTKDPTEAITWYSKATAMGSAVAPNSIGLMYLYGSGVAQDYAQAVKWFQQSANMGYSVGELDLGYMYDKGYGLTADPAQAMEWYKKAATLENSQAEFNLGSMYMNGTGVAKDLPTAFGWYVRSANHGNVVAARQVGNLYFAGLGVDQSYTKGFPWYMKAAQKGDVFSAYEVGAAYKSALGVGQDTVQARVWLQKATDQGDKDAAAALASLDGAPMTPVGTVFDTQADVNAWGEQQQQQQQQQEQAAATPQVDTATQQKIADLTSQINQLVSDANDYDIAAAAADAAATQSTSWGALADHLMAAKARSSAANNRQQAEQLRQQLIQYQGNDNGAKSSDPSLLNVVANGLANVAERGSVNASVNVGGGGSGGGAQEKAAAAQCNADSSASNDMQECKQSPGLQQAACYKAAANLCLCYYNNIQTDPMRNQWLACYQQNMGKLGPLQSQAPTIGR